MSKSNEQLQQEHRTDTGKHQGGGYSPKNKTQEWPRLYDPATLSKKAQKWNFSLR